MKQILWPPYTCIRMYDVFGIENNLPVAISGIFSGVFEIWKGAGGIFQVYIFKSVQILAWKNIFHIKY